MLALAQRLDEGAPRSRPLFKTGADTWAPGAFAAWAESESGVAAPRPDGAGICLLLHDPQGRYDYLAEWTAKDGRMGALTGKGDAILAKSVQYAGSDRVVFLRRKTGRERSLWLLERGEKGWTETPVAFGPFGNTVAVHPEGHTAALTMHRDTGPEVVLVSVPEGDLLRSLGPGEVWMESWHPSGAYLVVCTNDRQPAQSRLWATEAVAPWRRLPLVEPHAGHCTAAAVSRDGNWTVFANDVGHRTELAFVELDTYLFQLKTAQHQP